jgi:hypothetical protein
MQPLDVFRHLTRQVRARLIDLFSWPQGSWRWWRDRVNPREAFPLGLDAYEVIGAGVSAMSIETLELRLGPHMARTPRAVAGAAPHPDRFKVGPMPADLLGRLDGRRWLADWIAEHQTHEQRLAVFRGFYLLIETGLAELTG